MMGCVNSNQPRHSPLVNQEDDPWDSGTSIALTAVSRKVVIVGDEGVGKTSFVLRLTSHKYDENTVKTTGIDFWRHNLAVNDENVSLQIWDTSGDPTFTKIAEAYYRSAHGFIVVFSTIDKNSYLRIPSYLERIKELNTQHDPITLLVGSKCDEVDQRQVDLEEIEQFASQRDLQYFEISSKNNVNVDSVVTALANIMTSSNTLN